MVEVGADGEVVGESVGVGEGGLGLLKGGEEVAGEAEGRTEGVKWVGERLERGRERNKKMGRALTLVVSRSRWASGQRTTRGFRFVEG